MNSMDYRFLMEKTERPSSDYVLMGLVVLLAGIGLSTLFSASYHYGNKTFSDPAYFIRRQMIFSGAGVVFALFFARVPLDLLKRGIPALLLLSLLCMLATFIPGIGQEIMGARRWIIIGGRSFQPSELVKFSLILYLSYLLSKKEERITDFFNSVLPPLIIVGAFTALIYLQNDFSTAFFVFFICLFLFFISGIRLSNFIFIFVSIVPLAGMMLFTREHRVRRLMAFIDPGSDPIGTGYQVLAAQGALREGSLFGLGLGLGTRKLGGLPEAHSDFIFAVLGEEAGFLGVLFVLALFVAFAVRGYGIAVRFQKKDLFCYYLAFGLTTTILYQALVNMAVVSGLFPATGLPLPFFSHGGSSVLVTFMMIGLLLNLSKIQRALSGGAQ